MLLSRGSIWRLQINGQKLELELIRRRTVFDEKHEHRGKIDLCFFRPDRVLTSELPRGKIVDAKVS